MTPTSDKPGDGVSGTPAPRRQPDTASGMHEDQLAAEDLARLREAVVLRSVTVGLRIGEPQAIDPGLALRSSVRLAIAPLPKRARIKRLGLKQRTATVRRDLPRALAQPVRRRRLLLGELNDEQEKLLYRQLYEQYGPQAREFEVAAVFAHVPPEAARSVRIAPDLRSLLFVLPADVSPRGIEAGHYMVVLREKHGKTSTALVRL